MKASRFFLPHALQPRLLLDSCRYHRLVLVTIPVHGRGETNAVHELTPLGLGLSVVGYSGLEGGHSRCTVEPEEGVDSERLPTPAPMPPDPVLVVRREGTRVIGLLRALPLTSSLRTPEAPARPEEGSREEEV